MIGILPEGGPLWLFLLARLIELAALVFMTVVWCLGMDRALRACDFSSRRIQPGQSFLIFIPLFGLVWQFIMVNKVSDSLAGEYHLRGWKSDEGRPAIETGLIACVVVLIVFLVRVFIPDFNPGLAFLTTLGICICMYMHRERLIAFSERLEAEQAKAQQAFFDNVPNPFAQQQPFAKHFNPQFQQQPAYYPPAQNPFEPPQHTPQYQPSAYPGAPSQSIPPVQQYTHQQFANQAAQQFAQQQKKKEADVQASGWDGVTTWEAPDGWKHPDLSDPSSYFS